MDKAEARPWWTVDQARRWIVHRDPDRPLAIEADRSPPTAAEPDRLTDTERRGQTVRPVPCNETEAEREAERERIAPMLAEAREAADALKRAIADGHVAARGIREPGLDPEPIPPAIMANPAVALSLAGSFIGPDSRVPGWERIPLPMFRHVEVERAAVVGIWCPRPAGAEEAAAWLSEHMASAPYKVAIPAVRQALKVTEVVARAAWDLSGLTRGRGRKRSSKR